MNSFTLDFIGIGAAKAATTWIAQCLAEHPGICMSEPKELNFFGRRHVWPPAETHHGRGRAWLAKHFRDCRPGQVRGEYSVGYLIDPESPAIIKREMAGARLIVSLRNPIDCLYSLYFNFKREYAVPKSFEGLIAKYPEVLAYGDYCQHLNRFLEEFPGEQLHIVLFDDIRRDPAAVIRSLFEYVGTEPSFQPPSLHSRVNDMAEPRMLWLRDVIGGIRSLLRSTPPLRPVREALRAVGGESLASWVQKKNWRPMAQPPMKEETRAYLRQRYTESNRQLGALINRDLSHWD